MSSLYGWMTIGACAYLLQGTGGCDQTTNALLADSLTQLLTGLVTAFINQIVGGFFNVPTGFSF